MTLGHGRKRFRGAALMMLGLVLFGSPFGCGDDDDHDGSNAGGESGQGGEAGSAGTSSSGGAGGDNGGAAGAGAVAGRAGAGGSVTEGGAAGSSGGSLSGGSAGTSGDGGTSSGGSATGGAAGAAGSAGEAGAGGLGGGESTEGTANDVCINTFCGAGRKVCGGACVDISDPAYGCAASSCDPCSKAILNAGTACVKGACSALDCRDGFADCNSNLGDGCEADLTAPGTCDTCGISCTTNQTAPFCSPGGCAATCPFPTTNCSGACRDLSTSPLSCGACGTRCPVVAHGQATCIAGSCNTHPICDTGFVACGSECVDLASDPEHCGDCDTDCTATKDPLGPYETARCENSACTVACENGFTRCGGDCTSLRTDPEHCGSCANDCGAGNVCIQGRCQSGEVVQVITGLSQPEDIYVDAMNIYWTDIGDNTVWQADKATFEKVLLADHQSKPWRIVADAQKVYWTSNLGGGVITVPIGGGNFDVIYPANRPTGLAVDDSSIFWSNDGTGQIFKAPKVKDVSAPFLAHTADELYIDATRIYGRSLVPDSATVPDSVFGADKTTAAAVYYDQTLVPGLTIDSSRAYWYRAADHYVGSSLKNGTDRITQRFAAPSISFMKSDDCHLFFVEPPHRIWNLPHASDRNSKLNVVTGAGTAIRRLAIDSRYIYWTDGGGFIGRVPR